MSERKSQPSAAAAQALRRARQHPAGPDLAVEELVLFELSKADFAGPTASSVIRHLDELRRQRPNLLAVVYVRESTWRQRKSGNLYNRHKALQRQLREKGIPVLGQYRETVSGKDLDARPQLRRAIEAARELQAENPGATVIVITDARNRFLRGAHFNGQSATDPPFDWQLEELKALAGDVVLATLLPPDAPADVVRAYETKVAGDAGKQYGRPRGKTKPKPGPGVKKTRRERLRPRALKLRRRGESVRTIAKRLKVPRSTVAGWLKSS